MPFPTATDPMGGKLSVEIGSTLIPSDFLGPLTANVSQVLRKSSRLSGTTTTPSNQLDDPSFDVIFFPNKWSDLQYFFPDNFDGTSMVFGGSTCTLPETVLVALHYECEADEERDVTFPVARVSFEDKSERNATDDLSVVIHIYPQVNPLGQIIYGTIGS